MTTQRRVLFVLTSHDDLGGLRPTGFYVSEAAHPWHVLHAAGVRVDLASIAGGAPPQDGRDTDDPIQRGFLADPQVAVQLQDSPRLCDVDPASYDAVLFVGGHGTMWDFPADPDVARLGRGIYEAGGIIAAVCHGPAALLNVTLSDGTFLIAGRAVGGFSDSEESAIGLTEVVPFLLADALASRGATYTAGPDFTEHVVVDGRLITGQNPQSATRVGQEMLAQLVRIAS